MPFHPHSLFAVLLFGFVLYSLCRWRHAHSFRYETYIPLIIPSVFCPVPIFSPIFIHALVVHAFLSRYNDFLSAS